MVTRSVRTNERTDEPGGRTARKHNAFADADRCRKQHTNRKFIVEVEWVYVEESIVADSEDVSGGPTGNVEVDFEAVLAGAVASDACVMPGVRARRRVEDERADAVLVDDDLVQPVFEHLGPVAEPVQVGVRSPGDDAVEARHRALRHLDVGRDLAERRPKERLRHAAQLAVVAAPIRRTMYPQNHLNVRIGESGGGRV